MAEVRVAIEGWGGLLGVLGMLHFLTFDRG